MDVLQVLFIAVQIVIGYNLILPLLLFLFWKARSDKYKSETKVTVGEKDYGVIVTAYGQTQSLPGLVNSVLNANYSNFIVYIVADNCDISNLHFEDPRIVLLRPPEVLASNTKSHKYAIQHFLREHDYITILDSDNLIDQEYFGSLNLMFQEGFAAVQGVRKPKNLNTTIAALDAARDIYYHFYDGKILFELGSSATLSGSGMAFETKLYRQFMEQSEVEGAGFDKVLQYWLVENNYRISFSDDSIVYDEKTSKTDQLVQQRSRWINSWFRYFKFGFRLVFLGIKNWSRNQFLFGLILLRPPLFLFILLSVLFLFINIFISISTSIIWLASLLVFIMGFYIALKVSKADKIVYKSLINIPTFIFFQVISLLNIVNANKKSVATEHFHNDIVDSTVTRNENKTGRN